MDELKIPDNSPPSRQIDLFRNVMSPDNRPEDMSNLIQFWDFVPKFFMTRAEQEKLRGKNGQLGIIDRAFEFQGEQYTVEITPAQLKEGDQTVQYYPSAKEEIIEDVLRKIFLIQANSAYDPDNKQTWVKFSLNMIKKELKEIGKGSDLPRIKESIEILKRTYISIKKGKKEIYSGTLLSASLSSRDDYLVDGSALSAIRFADPVSIGIFSTSFRQFNYKKMMSLSKQLSRWLFKQLSYKYINADYDNVYTISFSQIESMSGLLNHKNKRDRLKAVRNTLDELVTNKIIISYKENVIMKSVKIDDVIFRLQTSRSFIGDMKAHNLRNKHLK